MSKKFLTENMIVALKEIAATGKSNNKGHRVEHLERRKLVEYSIPEGRTNLTALGRMWARHFDATISEAK